MKSAVRRSFVRDVLWLVLFGKVRTCNDLCPSLQVSPPYSCRIVTNDVRYGADSNHNNPHSVDIFAFTGNNQFQGDDSGERNESVSNGLQPNIPIRLGPAPQN
jgi:hypothetical protein